MPAAMPFNLHQWIDRNRDLLKPPVGNKLLFADSNFIIMAVGGPNSRKDYHHDPSDEFFFQVKGDMLLKTLQDGRPTDVPAGSVGIVVERRRAADELDGFSWYCENCGNRLYMERIAVRDIESQLPEIFARFYSSVQHRTCGVCGTLMQVPS
jgi:3-hydroxyanthranilate 3,4-dioxygenase